MENGWVILYRGPDVSQVRNEHCLMRNFEHEMPGYVHNREIGERLDRLKLRAGPANAGDNLIRGYEELIDLAVLGSEELALVKAWVEDVAGELAL